VQADGTFDKGTNIFWIGDPAVPTTATAGRAAPARAAPEIFYRPTQHCTARPARTAAATKPIKWFACSGELTRTVHGPAKIVAPRTTQGVDSNHRRGLDDPTIEEGFEAVAGAGGGVLDVVMVEGGGGEACGGVGDAADGADGDAAFAKGDGFEGGAHADGVGADAA
jgi:hypothetical protein